MKTTMRYIAYIGTSTLLTLAVIQLAAIDRPNFYSACVAISQSSGSMLVIINMAFILTVMLGKVIQMIFFGELRALELEHMYERGWYAITETGLAMTIFKDSFSFKFAASFGVLMFLRVFHWIASDRVDLIFQTAQPPSLSAKVRLASALLTLTVCDLYLLKGSVLEVLESGPGDIVMFAFEFALLQNSAISSIGRYILNLAEAKYLDDNPDEDNWENKGTWTFILEAATDFTRLAIYIAFFVVMLQPYGMPLHIVRDVYMTASGLIGRIRDYVRFRRARLQMDRAIANATQEELDAQEDICIICREEMLLDDSLPARYTPKKLACGHVIHHGCLKSWLERSQNCPTCRSPVFGNGAGGIEGGGGGGGGGGGAVNHLNLGGDRNNVNNNVNLGQPPQENGHGFDRRNIQQDYNINNNDNRTGNGTPTPTPTTDTGARTPSTSAVQPPPGSLVFNSGFQMPVGWTALKARQRNGAYEIQLNEETWAAITDTHGRDDTVPFLNGESSSPGVRHHADLLTREEKLVNKQINDKLDKIEKRMTEQVARETKAQIDQHAAQLNTIADRMVQVLSRFENPGRNSDEVAQSLEQENAQDHRDDDEEGVESQDSKSKGKEKVHGYGGEEIEGDGF